MTKRGGSFQPDAPSASELILDILGMLGSVSISPAQAEKAGKAYGYSAATMRATLSRLRSKGKLHTPGRGRYRLPENTSVQWVFNRGWQRHIAEPVAWKGRWVLASWADNASLLRNETLSREALLDKYGFRKWRPQLFVRPDNLCGKLPGMRQRLATWPEGAHISLTLMGGVDPDHETQLFSLWPERAADYGALTGILQKSRDTIGRSTDTAAAAEVLSLGRLAVKSLLRDPRLPKPKSGLLNLAEFGRGVRDYELFGIDVWKSYLDFPYS